MITSIQPGLDYPCSDECHSALACSAADFATLPVMHFFHQHPGFRASLPLRKTAVLALLHLFPNAAGAVRTWIAFGAVPEHIHFFYKDYRYPAMETVLDGLRALGIATHPVGDFNNRFLVGFEAKLAARDLRLLVVEDGGQLTPLVHAAPGLLARTIGFCEQTTKGLDRIRSAVRRPRRPVLALPLSELKQAFEPPHVALAFVKTLDACLSGYLQNMRVAVLGCGCLGHRIAEKISDYGADVTVFDPRKPKFFRLLDHNFSVSGSAVEAVAGRDVVIGCAGTQTIDAEIISRLNNGCAIASASSERVEVDVDFLRRNAARAEAHIVHGHPFGRDRSLGTVFSLRPHGRRITLLGDGKPLNFLGFADLNPFPFDLIMAVFVAGGIALAAGDWAEEKGFLNVFDAVAERFGLIDVYLHLHHKTN